MRYPPSFVSPNRSSWQFDNATGCNRSNNDCRCCNSPPPAAAVLRLRRGPLPRSVHLDLIAHDEEEAHDEDEQSRSAEQSAA